MKYGKLEGGNLKYARKSIEVDGIVIERPTAAQYLSAGWKFVIDNSPSDPATEGYHYEMDGYEENDTEIRRKWKQVEDPVVTKRYSVPDLFFWLRGYDEYATETKGQATVDWLNSMNLYTVAVTTRVVSADNELFTQALEALKTNVGFTDAEIADALAYAETDAMPDAAT